MRILMFCLALVLGGCGSSGNSERGPLAGGGVGSAAAGGSSGVGNPDPNAASASGNGGAGAASAGSGGASGSVPLDEALSPEVRAILGSACFQNSVESALLPANILFVVDRSGSMTCNPPPTTDSVSCEENPARADTSAPSKWEITSEALNAALTALPATATVGISYFSKDDSCGVSSEPSVAFGRNSAAQQAAVAASLGAVVPGGGTPIVGATILAYKHMHDAALAGRIFGNEFVVLITDGQQSEPCGDPAVCTGAEACTDYLVDEQVGKAAAAGIGIRTFVVGVPGSEPSRSVLSEIALEGQTAAAGCDPAQGNCHFDMTTVTDLATALSEALAKIAGQAIACELPVPQPTSGMLDAEAVNVVYTPGTGPADAAIVARDTAMPCDAGANGWQYTADNTKIRLCGAICDTVRSDVGARVDVVLGCPVFVVQ